MEIKTTGLKVYFKTFKGAFTGPNMIFAEYAEIVYIIQLMSTILLLHIKTAFQMPLGSPSYDPPFLYVVDVPGVNFQ